MSLINCVSGVHWETDQLNAQTHNPPTSWWMQYDKKKYRYIFFHTNMPSSILSAAKSREGALVKKEKRQRSRKAQRETERKTDTKTISHNHWVLQKEGMTKDSQTAGAKDRGRWGKLSQSEVTIVCFFISLRNANPASLCWYEFNSLSGVRARMCVCMCVCVCVCVSLRVRTVVLFYHASSYT